MSVTGSLTDTIIQKVVTADFLVSLGEKMEDSKNIEDLLRASSQRFTLPVSVGLSWRIGWIFIVHHHLFIW